MNPIVGKAQTFARLDRIAAQGHHKRPRVLGGWLTALSVAVGVIASASGGGQSTRDASTAPLSKSHTEPVLPVGGKHLTFGKLDLYVETTGQPLAAYQVEVAATSGTVRIVGIEGGEHPAFRRPPFYDPQAMRQERVILAAFNTSAPSQLPCGRTRVATIHFAAEEGAGPLFSAKLQAAATTGGRKMRAEIEATEATDDE